MTSAMRSAGIPFDPETDGPLAMPAILSGPQLIAWGAFVVPGGDSAPVRTFAWASRMDGNPDYPEYQLETFARMAAADMSRQLCPLSPQLIVDLFCPAAVDAAYAALVRRRHPESREWSVGLCDVRGTYGRAVVGVSAPRMWTGRIRLDDILAGRGDGRPPRESSRNA